MHLSINIINLLSSARLPPSLVYHRLSFLPPFILESVTKEFNNSTSIITSGSTFVLLAKLSSRAVASSVRIRSAHKALYSHIMRELWKKSCPSTAKSATFFSSTIYAFSSRRRYKFVPNCRYQTRLTVSGQQEFNKYFTSLKQSSCYYETCDSVRAGQYEN